MKNELRMLAAGLMLSVAPVVAMPAYAEDAGSRIILERNIEDLRSDIGHLKPRELRAYIKELKQNINSTNRKEYRAKIRMLRAELQNRRAQRKAQRAQQSQSGETIKVAQATADDVNKDARIHLRTAKPAGELNTRALSDRIAVTEKMLESEGLRKKLRNRLERMLQRDRGEYVARTSNANTEQGTVAGDPAADLNAAGQSADNAEQPDKIAEEVLSDNRQSDRLSEDELRARLKSNRRALRNNRLGDRYSTRLRERLKLDRTELRRRLKARRNGQNVQPDQAGKQEDLKSVLLNDRRPAHGLRTRELSLRIQRTRAAMSGTNLSIRQRNRLDDLLEQDRRELRNRLSTRRDRRRNELTRWRKNNEVNIVIAPTHEYAPRDDIAFAEVDDELVERQLVAPARRKVERRYSFEEYRRRPELRDAMPAIDVDSINFGFNESFVRDEEIDQLERLGAVIERIVAEHPDEVFLIEGHTDAVGSQEYNLALSEKRAEAVRHALLEYFVIEPRNLTTIGYGEQFLKVFTEEPEEENRRVSLRRITPVLTGN